MLFAGSDFCAGNNHCHENATCLIIRRTRYVCQCKDGFIGDGSQCSGRWKCSLVTRVLIGYLGAQSCFTSSHWLPWCTVLFYDFSLITLVQILCHKFSLATLVHSLVSRVLIGYLGAQSCFTSSHWLPWCTVLFHEFSLVTSVHSLVSRVLIGYLGAQFVSRIIISLATLTVIVLVF